MELTINSKAALKSAVIATIVFTLLLLLWPVSYSYTTPATPCRLINGALSLNTTIEGCPAVTLVHGQKVFTAFGKGRVYSVVEKNNYHILHMGLVVMKAVIMAVLAWLITYALLERPGHNSRKRRG